MKGIKVKKSVNLDDIITEKDIENYNKKNSSAKQEEYIYVKDREGYVTQISKCNLTDEYTVITKEEWEEKSGEKYYKETFGHGGKRKGAGRKPKTGLVLKFQVRLSEKEKEFINYARSHNLNYDELMQR